jgi:hypothetical protein
VGAGATGFPGRQGDRRAARVSLHPPAGARPGDGGCIGKSRYIQPSGVGGCARPISSSARASASRSLGSTSCGSPVVPL